MSSGWGFYSLTFIAGNYGMVFDNGVSFQVRKDTVPTILDMYGSPYDIDQHINDVYNRCLDLAQCRPANTKRI